MLPIEPPISIKIFMSYAHADLELRKKLEEHLSPLKYSGKITIWQDLEIPPGANWEDQINTHLSEADLILLLVSSSFIASHYCWNKEVWAALERHKAGTARVVPIILKPALWQDTPLEQLQALPTGAKPITQWSNEDAAFENVARGIRKEVEDLRAKLRQNAPRKETMVPPPEPSPLLGEQAKGEPQPPVIQNLSEQRDARRLPSRKQGIRLPEMVRVPAGPFIMGSPIGDGLRLSDEPEQFERNLDYDYKISKYPVTVGQYRAFINASGYHNSAYWTQAGWKWREQRIEPDYWSEDKWTSDDNLPVVGVSWYEAYAYTRWLAEVTRHDCKLPSEAEWEKAARGGLQLPNRNGSWRKNPNIARVWPWGNKQPDEHLLNFKRTVARSTSVDKFPQGVSPYHVFDMAGNVWEWCRSKWASPYVTQEDDDSETYAPRVVRGGSWNSEESYVRCAVRLKNHPNKASDQIGFRVILLL